MWKEYLSFSKSERITFLSLSVVIFLLLLLSLGIKAIDFSPAIDQAEERAIRDFYSSLSDSVSFRDKNERIKGEQVENRDSVYLVRKKSKSYSNRATNFKPRKEEEEIRIDINRADTAIFALLPGIGKTISARIVRYRTILKGFYANEQLLEVYGVDELLYKSILSYLTVDTIVIEKLNFNLISISQMKNHPYLSFYQAKEIYEQRLNMGKFKSMDEIFNLSTFKEVERERINRYFCVN